MKFSIKDFFNKFDQIRSLLPIWSHLLKKSLMENFTFCAVIDGENPKMKKWVQYFHIHSRLLELNKKYIPKVNGSQNRSKAIPPKNILQQRLWELYTVLPRSWIAKMTDKGGGKNIKGIATHRHDLFSIQTFW